MCKGFTKRKLKLHVVHYLVPHINTKYSKEIWYNFTKVSWTFLWLKLKNTKWKQLRDFCLFQEKKWRTIHVVYQVTIVENEHGLSLCILYMLIGYVLRHREFKKLCKKFFFYYLINNDKNCDYNSWDPTSDRFPRPIFTPQIKHSSNSIFISERIKKKY